jgi:transcriptional regulator with XRE-family HTH domain
VNDERSANAVDRRIGQRLRARRLETGLSQEQLADLLGVTFQQIQKYEKGINRIAASRLFELSAALDVTVAYFFDGLSVSPAGVAEDESPILDAVSSPEGLQLVTLFASIRNPRLRRRIVELVRVLADEDDPPATPG